MDETRLINDAVNGDLDAFNRLVLAYQDKAYNLAYRMLSDGDAAEDATQNAFISAYRGLAGYHGGSFKAWLMRMVANTCYDELRRRYRQGTVPLEPVNSENGEEFETPHWIADGNPSPEEQVMTRELDVTLQRCIQGLPVEFRVMVVLVDVQGYDYREASQVVGKPVGTVKSRLSRARLRLRNCLVQSGLLHGGASSFMDGERIRMGMGGQSASSMS